MKKRSTYFSIAVIVIGMLLMIISLGSCGFNFKKLDQKNYETNTHEITESFTSISISSKNADISFVPSESEKVSVVCVDKKKMLHDVSVNNGVLSINVDDERKWYDHITLFTATTPSITVYLPSGVYGALCIDSKTSDISIPGGYTFESINVDISTGDVVCSASSTNFIKINASTGDVNLSDLEAKDLSISLSTGDVILEECSFENVYAKTSTGDHNVSSVSINGAYSLDVSTGDATLSNVSCGSFGSTGNTGNLSLDHVTVANTLFITRSAGHIKLNGSDAGEIYIKTSTGDVKGSLLTSKIFITKTSTGDIDVPASTVGGRCEIKTSTGDIKITTP